MEWGPLVHGYLLERRNRFAVSVELDDGRVVSAHLPNSGRLEEVLRFRNECWLVPRPSPKRKTGYDLLICRDGPTLVSVDARLPPVLLSEAWGDGRLHPFGKPLSIEREVTINGHRLDLLVKSRRGPLWVETKSVTLVVGKVALFPDAPTERGQVHLKVLESLVQKGARAAVFFVIQRPDAQYFSPNETADPVFAQLLRRVFLSGVLVKAYSCWVTLSGAGILRSVPVRLTLPNSKKSCKS
ncbi:MAG: DNA/RNA nuclease SfsA [Armatimonadetes bacterium]|nr:DNA/RNA nuclease SfsA [Armatimonadota bacterium]MDW8121884.1 DNA/RNA nuclease SfsA [Armatimonadota bacterium]